MNPIAGLLKNIPLLSELPLADRSAIADVTERRVLAAGVRCTVAGEIADGAYLLLDDGVESVPSGEGGDFARPVPAGATILELAMIAEVTATATCIVRSPTKVIGVPRAAMLALLEHEPAIAERLLASLTKRLDETALAMRQVIIDLPDVNEPNAPVRQAAG